jgi:hypothetical protein
VIGTPASVIAVVVFVGTVVVTGWQIHPPASASLKYNELTKLSNYELRERGFRISSRINDLRLQYQARQKEIFSVYDRLIEKWNKDSAGYDAALFEYKNWHATYDNPFGFTPSFGLRSSLLGLEQQRQQALPAEPPNPSSPGPEPEAPVVSVDKDWQQKMEAVQEEAAAVWEEICHRPGYYPRLFDVPTTYKPSDELAKQVTGLRDLANTLH